MVDLSYPGNRFQSPDVFQKCPCRTRMSLNEPGLHGRLGSHVSYLISSVSKHNSDPNGESMAAGLNTRKNSRWNLATSVGHKRVMRMDFFFRKASGLTVLSARPSHLNDSWPH